MYSLNFLTFLFYTYLQTLKKPPQTRWFFFYQLIQIQKTIH
jgi:hypothetical protein